jgi:hypothetical protein
MYIPKETQAVPPAAMKGAIHYFSLDLINTFRLTYDYPGLRYGCFISGHGHPPCLMQQLPYIPQFTSFFHNHPHADLTSFLVLPGQGRLTMRHYLISID